MVLFFDDYQPNQATILHAGDSRAYRIRDGLLERLTLDHSLAASAGLSHDHLLPSIFRGVITRAIGLDNITELDEGVVQVKANDCYLLCSDGLTKMISDSDIQNLIHKTSDSDLTRLAATLVEAANRTGGEDNISVILIRVGVLPAPIPRPPAIDDDANTTDKSATADAAIPAGGPNSPGSQTTAGNDNEPDRHSETEDLLVGVTPQTGLGSTPTTPTGVQQPGPDECPQAHTYPSADSFQNFRVKASEREVQVNNTPPKASHRSIRRYLLVFAAIIVLLAVIIIIKARLQDAPSAGQQQPAIAILTTTGSDTGNILNRITGDENTAQWTAERNKALEETGYAAGALNAYRNAATTLCTQTGLLPADTATDQTTQTAETLADAYCIQLFDLQQHLRAQIEAFINERCDELAIFGEAPTTVLENIRRFADLPVRTLPYPFAALRHDLQLVATWLAEDRQRLIPLEEIRSGPPSILPLILTQRHDLWAAILADIEACGPAIAKRQIADPDNHLLNNIASLQRVIMKTAPANRDRISIMSWPDKDNLPTLEGFFARVGRYLDHPTTTMPPEVRGQRPARRSHLGQGGSEVRKG